MNAIELLTRHHRELEKNLNSLKHAERVNRDEFNATADSLAAHVTVEEEIFYPAVKAERTEDILLESLEEHLSLKRVLADLLALGPEEEKFGPKMHVLAEQAEHHHKEEEEHLFPKVTKLLSADRLDALGTQMAGRMDALTQRHVRDRIPSQTEDSASLS
ncbi:MAG TPA: hemerythrin domain-containing protein [Myxococcaceae bacterium]|nr:hemerythrin domain-containing protein [Myxococcaceae bacterium]